MQELLLLEDDVKALEEMYPQGEKVIYHKKFIYLTGICFKVVYLVIFISLRYLLRLRPHGL